jgi:hypothetical protein
MTTTSHAKSYENYSTYTDLIDALSGYHGMVSHQVYAILECLVDVCVPDHVPASIAFKVFGHITSEYRDFHSPIDLPKGSENWRKTKVRLLYPHEIKIDAAFRRRATRHARHDQVRADDAGDRDLPEA